MKNIFKTSLIAFSVAALVSCGDDYLEEEPSEFLTIDQVAEAAETNPDVIAGTMNGIYALTVQTGTGGTTGHDDFGHKGYDIYADFLSGDMALSVSTYGWYRANITEFIALQDFTNTDNYQVWRYYYRIIRSCNTVIDALGGNDVVPELAANKAIMGQAKAMRAHSYFYLAQYMQKEYVAGEEILPIYTSLSGEAAAKSPASEVYGLMEQDLLEAIDLLNGYQRGAKSEINQNVAKGILAYVYGAMGRDGDAASLANQVVTSGEFTLMSDEEVTGGFNDLSTSGWMWGIDLTSDLEIDLVSWWGQMDAFSYSYAWAGDAKAIDAGLYAQIPDDDVRKAQFQEPEDDYYDLMPLNKFYAPARVIGGQRPMITDLVYLRVAEMYLLAAEGSAKSGDEGTARTRLKQLVSQRVPDASYIDGLSGQALRNEIYLQTRIELWGEGKSYLALKRNKANVVRGANHLSFVGESIPYNDERLTFEIPQLEIQFNPLISSQND